MKLAMALNYTGDPVEAAREAADLESAGIDLVWVPEVYSFDAVSILGFLAAKTERMQLSSGILPIYSRTPTLTAMTAAGLDAVSGGRFVLGLGASGPQVIEGWHGVPYTQPLAATREIVEICRKVWRRETLVHQGRRYTLPLPPEQGTGLGKALKLINQPVRPRIPIFLASLGHKNVALTAEIADGWLPVFFHPDRAGDVWGADLQSGFDSRPEDLPALDIVAGGTASICDEDTATKLRDGDRFMTALYVGGMGAKGKNFYNNIFQRYGYAEEAKKIQDLYLDGHRDEAMAAVPDDYLKATALVGDERWVKERVEAYRAAGVTYLTVNPVGPDPKGTIAKIKEWAS